MFIPAALRGLVPTALLGAATFASYKIQGNKKAFQ
jgi:hypothetical protein